MTSWRTFAVVVLIASGIMVIAADSWDDVLRTIIAALPLCTVASVAAFMEAKRGSRKHEGS